MKVSIDSINSAGIRSEMEKNHYSTADYLGTFRHPQHDGPDWAIRLYRAADALVFDTNADPVWQGYGTGFDELAAEYGVNLEAAIAEEA